MGKNIFSLCCILALLFVNIARSELESPNTSSEKPLKRIPPFSLQKDMNNDQCNSSVCDQGCHGYCLSSSSNRCRKSEEDAPEDSPEENLKSAVNNSTRQAPPYSHTACLCSRTTKRVRNSVCYTHNNQPPDPALGGDYSQVLAYEECQGHCSRLIENGLERDGETPKDLTTIYAALCDTQCHGRLQRFCYCVGFPYQDPGEGWGNPGWSTPPEGQGWGEEHGWGTPEEGNGWGSPPHGNGWSTPPVASGWSTPPVGWTPPPASGWTPPANGWTPTVAHPPSPPSTPGWTPPVAHPPSPPSTPGWTPPVPPPPSPPSTSGWTPPSPGWSAPAPHSTGSGWSPIMPSSGIGWSHDDPHHKQPTYPEDVPELVAPPKISVTPVISAPDRAPTSSPAASAHIKPGKAPEIKPNKVPAKGPNALRPPEGKLPHF